MGAPAAVDVPTIDDAPITFAPGQFSPDVAGALPRFQDSFRAEIDTSTKSMFTNGLCGALSSINGCQDTLEQSMAPIPPPWRTAATRSRYTVSTS